MGARARKTHFALLISCGILLVLVEATGAAARMAQFFSVSPSIAAQTSWTIDRVRGRMRKLQLSRGVNVKVPEIAEVVHPYLPSNDDVRRPRQLQQAAPYCVAVQTADQTALQAALDWACGTGTGQGNVDCSALQQGGACYTPDTLLAHATYAFDSYYVKQNGATGSCAFGGVATTTSTNPSTTYPGSSSCTYPSVGNGGGSSTPSPPSVPSVATPPPPPGSLSPTVSPNSTSFGGPSATESGTLSSAPITLHQRSLCAAFLSMVVTILAL